MPLCTLLPSCMYLTNTSMYMPMYHTHRTSRRYCTRDTSSVHARYATSDTATGRMPPGCLASTQRQMTFASCTRAAMPGSTVDKASVLRDYCATQLTSETRSTTPTCLETDSLACFWFSVRVSVFITEHALLSRVSRRARPRILSRAASAGCALASPGIITRDAGVSPAEQVEKDEDMPSVRTIRQAASASPQFRREPASGRVFHECAARASRSSTARIELYILAGAAQAAALAS